ncbi:hypothetical protein [Streptomyces sp. NPDC048603]|uniref:hypothetical protein n=1 Tax=Streptomyces sp. NPDC048603 TaxID=3365577 RepID=UPI003715A083
MERKVYAVTVHYGDENGTRTYPIRVEAAGWESAKAAAIAAFRRVVAYNRSHGHYAFSGLNIVGARPRFLHYV